MQAFGNSGKSFKEIYRKSQPFLGKEWGKLGILLALILSR
jgi:hypothetical protein